MTDRVVSDETRLKLSLRAKNRKITNNKGTIWVVDNIGNRKRVFPDNIPNGYDPVNKHKELK